MIRLCSLALTLAILLDGSVARADVIASWTFEISQPLKTDSATIAGILPEIGSGSASAVHASAATDYSNPVGNGSAESFSSNNWAVGDYYQFQVSTLGFANIMVTYDQTRSGTGPTTWDFEYSTDGINFTNSTNDYALSEVAWSSGSSNPLSNFSRDLSALASLDEVASVYFRVTAASAPGSAAGTSRVDNFTVSGTAVPEPSTLVLLGLALPVFIWRLRKSK